MRCIGKVSQLARRRQAWRVGIVMPEIPGADNLPAWLTVRVLSDLFLLFSYLSYSDANRMNVDLFVVISFGLKVFCHSRLPVWDGKLIFHVSAPPDYGRCDGARFGHGIYKLDGARTGPRNILIDT